MNKIQDDYSLIYAIKNDLPNASKSLEEILPKYEGSIIKTFSNYTSNTGICMQDIANDKLIVLHRAIKTFDGESSKLNTWVTNIARFHILNVIKQWRRHEAAIGQEPEELNKLIDAIYNQKENLVNDGADIKEFIWDLACKGGERLKTLVKLRFLSEKQHTYREIAERVDLSYEMVRLILEDFLEEARLKIKSKEAIYN